jgi:hypothetical protein
LRAIRADFLVLAETLRFDRQVVSLLKTWPASEPFTESRANAHRLPVPQADRSPAAAVEACLTSPAARRGQDAAMSLAECWVGRPGLLPFALTQAHCGHGG